jgi:hypothetical protein
VKCTALEMLKPYIIHLPPRTLESLSPLCTLVMLNPTHTSFPTIAEIEQWQKFVRQGPR